MGAKKTDVVEHSLVNHDIGVLRNEPPAKRGLLFI
jgi:hypothetical protein